jgi:purine-binding chemotaxis protein CheW
MTTESVARPHEPSQVPEPTTEIDVQIVVCVVADERYGIDVGRVREIIRSTATTALPGTEGSFSGVINLRGRVIPVMDLRRRFGLPDAPPTRLSRIVVADAGGAQIGLVVDAVNEVVHVAASAIEPTPALAAGAATEHLTGIARATDGLIVMLDLERLIGGAMAAVTDIAHPGASA